MRYVLCCVVGVCVVAASAVGGLAQEGGLPNLTNRLVVVRFSLVAGRIQATADQAGFEREQTTTVEPGRHETLSVRANDAEEASIEYKLTTDNEELSVDVSDGYDFSFSWHSKKQITASPSKAAGAHAADVEFHQPRTGPITLSVTENGVKREIQGETLWYLLLSEPELCRQHLLPLMSMLRGDWRLVETAQAIESQMLRISDAYRPANIRRWTALVSDLASDRFVVRQTADRALRLEGTKVIPFLESLERRELDLEQSTRIASIVQSRIDLAEDTPEQEACNLMDNRALWLVLLARPQESTRRDAARQLGFLLGTGSLQFDPGAAEPVRKAQIDTLRKQIEAAAVEIPGNSK